ncbi:MAG: hypothetical protein ACLR5H_06780 [Oscillospiraceae bacterium]
MGLHPRGRSSSPARAQIATSTDGGNSWTNAYINFSNGSAGAGEGLKSGWQYLEADLTSYAGAKIRVNSGMLFRAMVTTGGIGWYTTDGVKLDKSELKGYILLDNLCVVYGANNQDVTAPVVSSIQLVNDDGTKTELEDGAVLNSGNLRFFVTYDDSEETDLYATGVESAYFYFDGTYWGTCDRDNLQHLRPDALRQRPALHHLLSEGRLRQRHTGDPVLYRERGADGRAQRVPGASGPAHCGQDLGAGAEQQRPGVHHLPDGSHLRHAQLSRYQCCLPRGRNGYMELRCRPRIRKHHCH